MERDEIVAFLQEYEEALRTGLTTGSMAAAAACYTFPALVVRDRATGSYTDEAGLADDFATLSQRYVAAGLEDTSVEVTSVEPLTDGLTSVDVRWRFTNREGTTDHPESYRYVLRDTAAGPRIQVVTERSDEPTV